MEELKEKIARAVWDDREKMYPSYARRAPDALDEATGAWKMMVDQAAAALRAIEEAGYVLLKKEHAFITDPSHSCISEPPLNLEEPRG